MFTKGTRSKLGSEQLKNVLRKFRAYNDAHKNYLKLEAFTMSKARFVFSLINLTVLFPYE